MHPNIAIFFIANSFSSLPVKTPRNNPILSIVVREHEQRSSALGWTPWHIIVVHVTTNAAIHGNPEGVTAVSPNVSDAKFVSPASAGVLATPRTRRTCPRTG